MYVQGACVWRWSLAWSCTTEALQPRLVAWAQQHDARRMPGHSSTQMQFSALHASCIYNSLWVKPCLLTCSPCHAA